MSYCTKRMGSAGEANATAEVFRTQRAEIAPHQGETRTTSIQTFAIGDVAIVAVPAEFFTILGEEIKRQSPFRHTFVAELSNDWVGYVPDRRGHELGGYQTWTGHHSFCEPGTGERMVAVALNQLERLHGQARRRREGVWGAAVGASLQPSGFARPSGAWTASPDPSRRRHLAGAPSLKVL
jgi:hypothetical protein